MWVAVSIICFCLIGLLPSNTNAATYDVFGWGRNADGQFGIGSASAIIPTPVRITSGFTDEDSITVHGGQGVSRYIRSEHKIYIGGNFFSANRGFPYTPTELAMSTEMENNPAPIKLLPIASSVFALQSGKLFGWGGNTNGRMGTGDTLSKPVFTPTDNSDCLSGRTIVATSTGDSHTLFLTDIGSVCGAGTNSFKQLGMGAVSNAYVPATVNLGGEIATMVAAGAMHSLVVTQGGTKLFGFGQTTNGKLGTSGPNIEYPTELSLSLQPGETIISLSAGDQSSVFATSLGNVYTTGLNTNSASCHPTATGDPIVGFTRVVDSNSVLTGKQITKVIAGYQMNLILTSDGTLAICGKNTNGAFGNGLVDGFSAAPVLVPLQNVRGVIAGFNYASSIVAVVDPATCTSCSVTGSDGTCSAPNKCYCYSGYKGDTCSEFACDCDPFGSTGACSAPNTCVCKTGFSGDACYTSVITPPSPPPSPASEVYAWGNSAGGKYGIGPPPTPTAISTPTKTSDTFGPLDKLALSGTISLLWKESTNELLGAGTPASSSMPFSSNTYTTAFSTLPQDIIDNGVKQMYAGISCVFIVTGNDKIYTAGQNSVGRLGVGNTDVQPALTAVYTDGCLQGQNVAFVASNVHTLFITDTGILCAVGDNGRAQLGAGDTSHRYAPIRANSGALFGKRIKLAAAGGQGFSLAVTTDNILVAWGGNNQGQLGLGSSLVSTSIPVLYPMAVDTSFLASDETIVAIAANSNAMSAFVTSKGDVYSAGYNDNSNACHPANSGGIHVFTKISDPNNVLANRKVVQVVLSTAVHMLTDDGRVACCGANSQGILGNGLEGSNTPTPAPALLPMHYVTKLLAFPTSSAMAIVAPFVCTCDAAGSTGACSAPQVCICNNGYSGHDCATNNQGVPEPVYSTVIITSDDVIDTISGRTTQIEFSILATSTATGQPRICSTPTIALQQTTLISPTCTGAAGVDCQQTYSFTFPTSSTCQDHSGLYTLSYDLCDSTVPTTTEQYTIELKPRIECASNYVSVFQTEVISEGAKRDTSVSSPTILDFNTDEVVYFPFTVYSDVTTASINIMTILVQQIINGEVVSASVLRDQGQNTGIGNHVSIDTNTPTHANRVWFALQLNRQPGSPFHTQAQYSFTVVFDFQYKNAKRNIANSNKQLSQSVVINLM